MTFSACVHFSGKCIQISGKRVKCSGKRVKISGKCVNEKWPFIQYFQGAAGFEKAPNYII